MNRLIIKKSSGSKRTSLPALTTALLFLVGPKICVPVGVIDLRGLEDLILYEAAIEINGAELLELYSTPMHVDFLRGVHNATYYQLK